MTPVELLNQIFGKWHERKGFVPAEFPPDSVDTEHLAEALSAVKLTDKERCALICRFFHGHKFKEIGRRLGVTGGRAQQLIHHSLWKIRNPYNLKHIRRAVPGWFNHQRS